MGKGMKIREIWQQMGKEEKRGRKDDTFSAVQEKSRKIRKSKAKMTEKRQQEIRRREGKKE
jgi:hypothetical protein